MLKPSQIYFKQQTEVYFYYKRQLTFVKLCRFSKKKQKQKQKQTKTKQSKKTRKKHNKTISCAVSNIVMFYKAQQQWVICKIRNETSRNETKRDTTETKRDITETKQKKITINE